MPVKNHGFTLIEILLYLALFSIIIGGVMVAVYQIIESTQKTQAKVMIEEEGNFLLQKLTWAITGATEAQSTATELILTKPSLETESPLTFSFDESKGALLLARGPGDPVPLNNSYVKLRPADDVIFNVEGNRIDITFILNGRVFAQTRYLR